MAPAMAITPAARVVMIHLLSSGSAPSYSPVSGGQPPRRHKGKWLDPVEPDRGIRGIRDKRIAGLVKTCDAGRRRAYPGKLVQHGEDFAGAGRSRRGAPAVISQDDLAIIRLAGGAQRAGLAGVSDADSHSRHRALKPGQHLAIEIGYPRIGGSHVNDYEQPVSEPSEELLIRRRKRISAILSDVQDDRYLRGTADQDSGGADHECGPG